MSVCVYVYLLAELAAGSLAFVQLLLELSEELPLDPQLLLESLVTCLSFHQSLFPPRRLGLCCLVYIRQRERARERIKKLLKVCNKSGKSAAVLTGPGCAKKPFPASLSDLHQPGLLIRGRLSA